MWLFYSLNIDNILICICKTELVVVTKWELVFKCLEAFFFSLSVQVATICTLRLFQ
jgi:hypothetical protein